MLKPRALRPGDRVEIVSPASPFDRAEFDRGVDELRRLGFEPTFQPSVFARTGYMSGPPALRAEAFLQAWRDPEVAALIAVRGGYGSVQILPYLTADILREKPKLFIGYSDTTSLLTWLTCGCGIVALHGPMLERRLARGEAGYDERSFLNLITGQRDVELDPRALTTVRAGEARGPVYGGNLSQLVASLGTPFAFDPPAGTILFLEDVNERPYRLDRMLTQLRFSGVLGRASALVFGEMPGCDEPGGQPCARDVVTTLAEGFSGPVLYGFPSGHTSGPTWSLPLGVDVRLVAGPRPELIVEESAVG